MSPDLSYQVDPAIDSTREPASAGFLFSGLPQAHNFRDAGQLLYRPLQQTRCAPSASNRG